MHRVINDQNVFTNFTRLSLTHEDLARCFRLLLLLLVGLPSIFLYMACSAPLCSECFFTSLESSEWIVCREETRQIGAAGPQNQQPNLSKVLIHNTPRQLSFGEKCVSMTRASHKQTQVVCKALKMTSWSFQKEIRQTRDHEPTLKDGWSFVFKVYYR